MIQCHLVTEADNIKLSSDNEVFQWLATVLESAVSGKLYRGLEFSAVEVVQVIVPPTEDQLNITMSMPVRLSARVSQKLHDRTSPNCCTCCLCPWPGPSSTAL